VRVEVNTLDWSLVTLIHLNHMLGSEIVQFDLFVVGAGGYAVAE